MIQKSINHETYLHTTNMNCKMAGGIDLMGGKLIKTSEGLLSGKWHSCFPSPSVPARALAFSAARRLSLACTCRRTHTVLWHCIRCAVGHSFWQNGHMCMVTPLPHDFSKN